MKFAVASQDFRTVTPHAGKANRFLLFDAVPGNVPLQTGTLDLPEEMTMHSFSGGLHPLDGVDVLIAGSAGAGLIAKLHERGIVAVVTAESDPARAVAHYLAGKLEPAAAHDGCGCSCDGHHHH